MASWNDIVGFGKGAGQGVAGAVRGAWEGLKGMAKGGYALATDPAARDAAWTATKDAAAAARQYGAAAYEDPAMVVRDARDAAGSAYTAFQDFRATATPEQWGEVVGGGAFDVATMLVPVGAVTKLGRAATLARAADRAEDAALATAKAFPKAKPKPRTDCPTAAGTAAVGEIDDLARRPGALPAQLAARRQVASRFFAEELELEPHQVTDMMKGVDLSEPVQIVDIPPPETMSQWMRHNGRRGNWFNPDPSQTPDMLGLNGDPAFRRLVTLKTPPGKALRSVASPILDNWTDRANPVATKGGGIQMTVSNAVRDAFGDL